MNQYPIPAESVTFKEEIKKSRFITHLAHTPGIDAAKAFIEQIKSEHFAARHNCWAFVAGAPNDSMQLGFSDDGEPSGTAGKPILAQLQGSGIGEITAVVTRYSGGIKLGTGGLVKAYGGGVKQALSQSQTKFKSEMCELKLVIPYHLESDLNHLLKRYGAIVTTCTYLESISIVTSVPLDQLTVFKAALLQPQYNDCQLI